MRGLNSHSRYWGTLVWIFCQFLGVRIHAAPVIAPARIQEVIPGRLFMYWFCARWYMLVPVISGRARVTGQIPWMSLKGIKSSKNSWAWPLPDFDLHSFIECLYGCAIAKGKKSGFSFKFDLMVCDKTFPRKTQANLKKRMHEQCSARFCLTQAGFSREVWSKLGHSFPQPRFRVLPNVHSCLPSTLTSMCSNTGRLHITLCGY